MKARGLLSLFTCMVTVGVGLVTASQQSKNHALAAGLSDWHRECEMIEASIEQLEVVCSSHIPGLGPEAPEEVAVDPEADAVGDPVGGRE